MRKRPVVAIDGPAGSGKSSVAREVARRLGFTLLDTGALYRCVALKAERETLTLEQSALLGELAASMDVRFEQGGIGKGVWLDDEEVTEAIRAPSISQLASRVSALPEVRHALLDTQRKLGLDGGVVLEGRDIGTVVFPDAEVKVFLEAPDRVRAQRRFDELTSKGIKADLEQVLSDVRARDKRDAERDIAPLVAAEDAVVVDTGELGLNEVVAAVLRVVEEKTGK
ncbi:MAG: (d)CMP kinase [Deltaproteobacteria bacterium]|nr:(d)CMP kinase [Deltaproteobacteria bacterium]